jgi:hypothetical protein
MNGKGRNESFLTMTDLLAIFQNPFSFYQLMGWIAVCFYVASFQALDPKKTILLWIPANSIMAVHYFGMGSYTACALAAGAILRDLGCGFAPKKYLNGIVGVYTVYIWAMLYVFYTGFYDVLITLGTTFTGLAALNRDHFWRQRCFAFTQQIILFGGFFLLGSLPAMAFVTFTFSSNVIGVTRKLNKDKGLYK